MASTKEEKEPLRKGDVEQGVWTDGICDCCKDPGMCMIVYFCNPVNTGQLYERFVQKGMIERLPMLSCLSISIFMWVGYLWTPVVGGFNYFFASVGMLMSAFTGICLFLIVCTVRKSVRTRDHIEPGGCGDFEDCCCALWCPTCTVCQLWRHERVTCAQYDLCRKTGSELSANEILEKAA